MEYHAKMSEEWNRVSNACREVAKRVFDWQAVTAELLKFLGDRA